MMTMEAALRETIEQALDGDAVAFEALIEQYSRLVYSQAVSILRQPQEAEDIVQDAFIKAYKYRKLLREPEKFPSWLLAITRNLARDRLRRRQRLVTLDDYATSQADESLPQPGRRLELLERSRGLRTALRMLPERHRLALELRYLEGLDYQTIQQTMGISNGALRGILDRARGGLRRLMSPMMTDDDSEGGHDAD